MFNVGDKIVYPMHGAGTIDAIENKNILRRGAIVLRNKNASRVKVMVPTEKGTEQIGVRSVINKEEASKVIAVLEHNRNRNVSKLE